MHFHVFAERGRVRVALVAAIYAAEVGLVGGVDVHVLFAVGAVRESSIAALEFALKRFFTYFI